MRVKSEIWVAALMRRVFSAGGFAAVVQRGSPEAGAIYITTRNRLGEVHLYAPAAQSSYDTSKPQDRLFAQLAGLENEQIDARLQKERRFDPDIWIIELEVADGSIGELIQLEG